MNNLIYRDQAIEAISKLPVKVDNLGYTWMIAGDVLKQIDDLPSAEPERKKGKWIEISWSEPDSNVCCTSFSIQSAKCSICGKYHTTPYLYSLDYFPYCPNCGAEMKRGE